MKLIWDSEARSESRGGGYRRVRSADPYHTFRWTKLSRAFRQAHPLCEECKRQGIIKEAAVVDHIIPWPVCEDFYDRSNLQSLCEYHNTEKGNRDKRIIAEYKQKHNIR